MVDLKYMISQLLYENNQMYTVTVVNLTDGLSAWKKTYRWDEADLPSIEGEVERLPLDLH